MSTTTTDPIADMLTRIRNAIAVNKSEISLPHSKVKESVARLLEKAGYVNTVKAEQDGGVVKTLHIVINQPGSNSRITEIVRMSSPGRRFFAKAEQIPMVKHGRGIVVVSTSHGMMTGDEAKKKRLGGELICKVY